MSKLLIIESPNKIKTLRQYLGEDFQIIATIGHIRDLAPYGMGFTPDFDPKWVIPESKNKKESSKKELVDEIKKIAKKSDEIYIATDPDREGEAIAWHVFEILDDKEKNKCKRVTFNEITKKAVLDSFENKRDIDLNWVHSQFARRIIDRLIGFKLSKLMQNKLKADSAGRVQSVALKFIEDREKEINNFKAEYWWTIDVVLSDKNELILKNVSEKFQNFKFPSKNYSTGVNFLDKNEAQQVLDDLSDEFVVKEIEEPNFYTSSSKPPYKTSTLQQDAINKLGWTSKKTTLVAQRLYEGVEIDGKQIALISYPRTDSLRLSESFVTPTLQFIEGKFGKEYVGKYETKKSKKDENIQDAHEAIRPIDAYMTPESLKTKLNKDDLSLYKLIYNRAVASLMSQAKFKKVTIKFDNNNNEFYTFSRECVFNGFRALYSDNDDENDKLLDLSKYTIGTIIKSKTKDIKDHETSPPQRYTQASLIAELEKAGVGRPSTYNAMANVALDRGYAELDKKTFVMTQIGKNVVDQLDKYFPMIINKDFTRSMEERLDNIAAGNEEWKTWIKDFNPKFEQDLKDAYEKMEKVEDEQVGRDCPKCSRPLVYKRARKSGQRFIACSGYPTCKHLEPLEQPKTLEDKCPECGSDLLMRSSKKKTYFVGCKGYPKCNYIMSDKLYAKFKEEHPNDPLPKLDKLDEFKKDANIRKFDKKKTTKK